MNFKCEVKSHKVRLQAYCNKALLKWSYLYLSIMWLLGYDVTSTRRKVATRLLSKRCTCSRHWVTVTPPKVNIWVFVKIRALLANDVTTTFGGVTPNILFKRYICCPRLVITIPLEVNYIIMVLQMLKSYSWSVFSLKWEKANMWMKDVLRFLRQLSFHVFMHFYVIKFESKQFCEIFVVNSLNFLFLLINLNKVFFWRTQIDTPIRCPICVLSVFSWLGFYVSKYFILRVMKVHFI